MGGDDRLYRVDYQQLPRTRDSDDGDACTEKLLTGTFYFFILAFTSRQDAEAQHFSLPSAPVSFCRPSTTNPHTIPGHRLIYLMPTILIPPIMTHSSTLCQRCVNGVAPGKRVTCLMTSRDAKSCVSFLQHAGPT